MADNSPPPGYNQHTPARPNGTVSPGSPDPSLPQRRSGLAMTQPSPRHRMMRVNSQGQEIVDDSYYDGKWWRKSSYSKLMALDAKSKQAENGIDTLVKDGSTNNDEPVSFAVGEQEESQNENSGLLSGTPQRRGSDDSEKSPAEKVRFILSSVEKDTKEDVMLNIELHALFCQMDVLCHFDDGVMGWKEAARWLKYEEKVEAGDRWSKPHVPTTSLHALFELRRCVAEKTCCVILDMDASHGCLHQVADTLKSNKRSLISLPRSNSTSKAYQCACCADITCHSQALRHVAELIVHVIKQDRPLSEEECKRIIEVLLKPHKHKHRTANKGKDENNGAHDHIKRDDVENGVTSPDSKKCPSKKDSPSKLKKAFIKKTESENETSALHYSYPSGMRPEELNPHKPNKRLMRKIPGGSEAANIMIGQVDFLAEPLMAFIRLRNSSVLGDLTEVAVPTRFIFLVLGPPEATAIWEYEEVGRAAAALFSDRVFCEVAYKASTRQDLLDGMDEFIDDLTVLPPSIWDPSNRLEPPPETISMEKIRRRLMTSSRHAPGEEAFHFTESAGTDPTLKRTGRLFGGLWSDMKRRYPQYWTDIKDGLHIQCLASIIFLYFACVTPIVTFGGLLGQATDNYMGTMETMLAGCICGLLWHVFSGQPLCIVGATGPLLIFEGILYVVCKDFGMEYLKFRFYVGAWIFLILLLVVALDLSALVAYITRFTEESFAVLISLIFIFEAFKKLGSIWYTHPIHVHTGHGNAEYRCHCEHPLAGSSNDSSGAFDAASLLAQSNSSQGYMVDFNGWHIHEDCITYQHRVIVDARCILEHNCTAANWTLTGSACGVFSVTHSVPDVFFLCCFLFIGTFVIAYFFRTFRTSTYFPSIVRTTVSDFAVLIAILCCTAIDFFMDLDTPKLQVPSTIKPTRDDRGWFVNPIAIEAWWIPLAAFVPALLATILIFLDQQITAVIVNRKEHKLKKGHGYHLDLFVLSFSILICSSLGMPWFVAATVRAITHVRSLIKESELRAPGERPQFLGVREQRVTGIGVHIFIGLSVLLTGILQHVPMAVLYGVFLYMGITSLAGVQFVDRILILLMPSKYQPDHIYLRHVQTSRVHLFTAVQITCMVSMWVVKSIKSIAILFPIMLIVLCIVRKCFDFMFTQRELYWLDHILPDDHRKKKEDKEKEEMKKKEEDLQKVPIDDEWDKFTSKRDYGVGKKPRHRKRSEAILYRYKQEKNKGEDGSQDEDDAGSKEHIPDSVSISFRERKFSI